MALYAFDGTGNIDEDDDNFDTNVVRFRELYAQNDGEENYLEGVGTKLGTIGKVLGGALGMGGRSRVEHMLDTVRDNINNGDKIIDVIGFSRGAALAVHFCNKLYKEGVKLEDGTMLTPEIRFLGLWDLVGSFGLSFNNFLDFQEINIGWDIKTIPDNVQTCRHAIALDERREAFGVTLLEPSDSVDLTELWFKGVHSDVGGGNGNVKRSNIALNWMLDEAAKVGVDINSTKRAEDKYAQVDWDAPISENNDVFSDPKRDIKESTQFHPSAKARDLDVGESHAVNVIALHKFSWARVSLAKGHQYKIWTNETDTWQDADITCNASGWESSQLSFLKETVVELFEKKRRHPEANWFELVGAYNNDNDAELFRVGVSTQFTATKNGELHFFANDLKSRYENNSGLIRVFIERLS